MVVFEIQLVADDVVVSIALPETFTWSICECGDLLCGLVFLETGDITEREIIM
jgi:hypothetical protein